MISKDTPLIDHIAFLQSQIYDPCGLDLSAFQLATESQEYQACTFDLNGLKIVFRQAKITPKKAGQFVTFWKRIAQGPIQPFDQKDKVDLLVVHVQQANRIGQFVFPKPILIDQGIISTPQREGKRAIRVYPPWAGTLNKQAQKTQAWQLNYFWSMKIGEIVDRERVSELYGEINK